MTIVSDTVKITKHNKKVMIRSAIQEDAKSQKMGFIEEGRRVKQIKMQENDYCDLVPMSKFVKSN